MNDIKLCIVEDDISALESLSELLKLDNFEVFPFSDPVKALQFIFENSVDIVISDIKMPELDGLTLLKKIKENLSDIDVILMTAFGDINNAVEAVKHGATNYILKPINYEELKNHIVKISETRKLKNIISTQSETDIEIVAESESMKNVLHLVKNIAETDSTVLVEGETGTGKELVSRLIHKLSLRKKSPFLPVNCAALPKELLEAELFGYEKGSFTGATQSRRGKFILAHKGTIFLDEISEMDYDIQAKLLRVIEDGVIEKIGSEKHFRSDLRIIAATNKNLEDMVLNGRFRKDLFFRLNVFKVKLPPLRERKEDIKPLSEIFIRYFNVKYGKNIKRISEDAMSLLLEYSFPGNIRELKHIIERAVLTGKKETIEKEDIFTLNLMLSSDSRKEGIVIPFNIPLREAENKIIIETLKKNNYNKKKTAEILKISVRTIEMRFKELGVSLKQLKG
jgi:DNA-binding NtrC family response regulator